MSQALGQIAITCRCRDIAATGRTTTDMIARSLATEGETMLVICHDGNDQLPRHRPRPSRDLIIEESRLQDHVHHGFVALIP